MSDQVLLLSAPKRRRKRQPYRRNNAYGVLGVHPDSSLVEIKRAYRRLAWQWHPDLNPSPESKQEFIRITKAYEDILNHCELVHLQMRCKVVETKVVYVETLLVCKRIRDFAGIEIDPVPIDAVYTRNDEAGKKMMELATYWMIRCPSCRWRQKCDRATGFSQVEDIHRRMTDIATKKAFSWMVRK